MAFSHLKTKFPLARNQQQNTLCGQRLSRAPLSAINGTSEFSTDLLSMFQRCLLLYVQKPDEVEDAAARGS